MTADELAARGAPERIWIIPDTSGVKHEWHSGWYQGRPNARHTVPYTLATPAALAASPEVQALLREAEARGMERAAKLVDKRAEEYDREFGIYDYTTGVTEYPGTGDESMEEWESISTAIRAEAATIRKGETP